MKKRVCSIISQKMGKVKVDNHHILLQNSKDLTIGHHTGQVEIQRRWELKSLWIHFNKKSILMLMLTYSIRGFRNKRIACVTTVFNIDWSFGKNGSTHIANSARHTYAPKSVSLNIKPLCLGNLTYLLTSNSIQCANLLKCCLIKNASFSLTHQKAKSVHNLWLLW